MSDPFFVPEDTPWSVIEFALEEWERGFFEYLSEIPESAQESYPDSEERARANDAIGWVRRLCQRAPALYRAMLAQELPADLQEPLEEISTVQLETREGFDVRRAFLVPNVEPLWKQLDLSLARDTLKQVQSRGSDARQSMYRKLIMAALQEPISPIASWYLQRASRLLLLGLQVECIAMCRAVLDAALNYALDVDDLEKAGIKRKGGGKGFDLAGLIAGATKLGKFSSDDCNRAHAIRKAGNDVLHPGDPERFDRVTHLDAVSTFMDLSVLLRRIFP